MERDASGGHVHFSENGNHVDLSKLSRDERLVLVTYGHGLLLACQFASAESR